MALRVLTMKRYLHCFRTLSSASIDSNNAYMIKYIYI